MNTYFTIAALFLWSVFLVCIATFAGEAGQDAAAAGAFCSILVLFMYGIWRGINDI